jgi:hypothetical protein
MMKKFICLVLVLSLASVSMAAFAPVINILVNGEQWDGQSSAKPSDIITVQWLETEETLAGSFSGGFNMNVDLADGPTALWVLPGYGTFPPPTAELVVVGDGIQVNLSLTYLLIDVPDNDILVEYSFHVPDGTPDSTWINIDTTGVYGSIRQDDMDLRIHITPEPMTIMLLGLGGLFLRRRII